MHYTIMRLDFVYIPLVLHAMDDFTLFKLGKFADVYSLSCVNMKNHCLS